ncbi:hypothetical protein [Loigolactobacillus bifermentans]|nr:hypothetical protein [Loigolactobacillus bifermentans]QGG59606.1 hypothetical protein LB003_03420 [Loigolactobacillus bifermentans]
MHYQEFVDYLEDHIHNKDAFYDRALDYQNDKNKARQKSKRWDQIKLDREVDRMWKDVTQNLYNTLQAQVPKNRMDPRQEWLTFFDKNDLFESVDESLISIEFE